MAAFPSESATASCAHCGKGIPASNIHLHQAHCARNLERCNICGDMIPKKHTDDHYFDNHAPVDCSSCGERVDREAIAIHKAEHCPWRIITCQYCDLSLPGVDLLEHQETCGNRTKYCHICERYVRLCEQADHEIHFHCTSNGVPESSRGRNTPRGESGGHRNSPAHGAATRRRIVLSVAVTGIAMVVGSVFLRKKVEQRETPATAGGISTSTVSP